MGSTDDPVNASATFRQLAVQKILAYLATFTVGRSDKVIAVSIDSYQAVLRRYGVGALKVMKVPLGMDTQKFRYTPSDIRNRFGIEAGAEVVLHVGRLEARNGSIFLFKAIPQVVKRHPHVKFVLVGKSTKTAPGGLSFKDYILEQAAADGFYNNLLFVDFLPDDELVRMYSACDVCVYPAVTSTYGLPAVEAMACGKPVVATSVGIVGELADESSSGLTAVQTKDSGGLAEAILRYLDLHQEERERVGVANRRLIESRLSISSWVDLVLGVYEGLLKENQALPRPKG
jgi:glycosyltransferase involved in cell wall biosynthesis